MENNGKMKKTNSLEGLRNKWKFMSGVVIVTMVIFFLYGDIKLPVLPTFNDTLIVPDSFTNASLRHINSKTNQSLIQPLPGEIQSLVFVKTHKCASSAIQNIILRFALSRRLNVLLPSKGPSFGDANSHIDKRSIVQLPKGQRFHIFCVHFIFNHREIMKYFPARTKYFGTLRHPLDQLESALYYYGRRYHKSRYNVALQEDFPLRAFLAKPRLYDLDVPNMSYLNNRMSIDFGFPVTKSFEKDRRNSSTIAEFIKRIDKTFHFIMIVELFDESLVLLRRLLRWRTEDILYFKLNVNSKQSEENNNLQFRIANEMSHRKWAPLDYAFYEHFKEKIVQSIKDGGEDFQRELKNFKATNKEVMEYCQSYQRLNKPEISFESTNWTRGFQITPEKCALMSKGEVNMVNEVRRRQLRRQSQQ